MKCKRCGAPLPGEGAICKFCGMAMDQSQVNYNNKMRDKNSTRITLLTEKYGYNNHVEYRTKKENKVLGAIIIAGVLLILIILAILITGK